MVGKRMRVWIDGKTVEGFIRPLPAEGLETLRCGHCHRIPDKWIPMVDVIQYGLFVDSQCYTMSICSICQCATAVSYSTGD
jgi:hypothetical protein